MDSETKVKQFLEKLESELAKQHISVPEFSRKMGVSKMTVYKWLRYETMMSLDKYFEALKVLKLTENDLNVKA